MTLSAIRVVVVVALVATACVPPPVRRVNRAALVPRLTPSLVDGAPMAQPFELAVGAASLAASAPGPGEGDAALEVPGTQLAGSLRVRFADYASIALGYAAGLDATARPIRPHQAPVDGGDAVGVGTALTLAVPVAPGWSIGVEAGVVGWELPWIEHSTCVANCPIGEPLDTTSEGRSVVMQGSFALTPTFRRGDWTVFASATIKNQPTIEHKDTEYGVDVSGDVEGGPGVWLGAVGLSARLVGDLRVSAILYAPLERGPVATGPSLATMLTLPLGPRRAP
ncbi:MAG: hypothetical protein IPH44_13240 [Myxococcales bacterium]|nr:hypothetical protein [Myxococcales bacterium]MBP6843402.1 hypothetical protein [Kofleriaceae bacterium]